MDGDGKKGRGRGRGRGRPRGRGRGRGRPKKLVIESDEEEIETSETVDNMVELETPVVAPNAVKPDVPPEEAKVEFSLDDDISQLIPPTFSTLSTGPPQPMIDLDWNHNYNPFGEKIQNANIHMCVTCRLPIRIYGRLIPCKHVYCYGCAKKEGSHCSQCNEKVHRIEQAHLGTVHMCLHGGARYGFEGCRRTYLSQRDLQAHFNHRHKPRSASNSGEAMANFHGSLDTPSSYSSRSIPVVHSSRSNMAPVQSQGSAGRSRPDSQSYSGSGGDSSRYDRKPYYQRSSWR